RRGKEPKLQVARSGSLPRFAGEGARTAAWKGAGSLCVRVDQPAHADRGRGGRMGGGFGLAAAAAAALAAPGAGGVAVAAGLTGADVGLAQLQAVLAQQFAQPRQAGLDRLADLG